MQFQNLFPPTILIKHINLFLGLFLVYHGIPKQVQYLIKCYMEGKLKPWNWINPMGQLLHGRLWTLSLELEVRHSKFDLGLQFEPLGSLAIVSRVEGMNHDQNKQTIIQIPNYSSNLFLI